MYSNEIVIRSGESKKFNYKDVRSILFTYDKLIIWESNSAKVMDTKGSAFLVKVKGIIDHINNATGVKENLNLYDLPLGETELYDMEIKGVLPDLSFEGCTTPVGLSLENKEDAFKIVTNNGSSDLDLFISSMSSVIKKFNLLYSDSSKGCKLGEVSADINEMRDSLYKANTTFNSCNFAPSIISMMGSLDTILSKAKSNPSKKLSSAIFSNIRVKYLMHKMQKDENFVKLMKTMEG